MAMRNMHDSIEVRAKACLDELHNYGKKRVPVNMESFCDTLHRVSWVLADVASGRTSALPTWHRLPDTRPTEWPWEGMGELDFVGVALPSGVSMLRLDTCWYLAGHRHSYITYVAPWADIAALLPGDNDA